MNEMNWGLGYEMLWADTRGTYTTYYKVVPNDTTNINESQIYSMTVRIS